MTPQIKEGANIDEAIERNWEIPNFTIKEIRDAIPAHCFRRDTFRSFTYALQDFSLIAILGYLASYIDHMPNVYARIVLWPTYWIVQGIVATGVWMLGHECGHQAFSPSKNINDAAGLFFHSFVLVPYYSWKFSHSLHHKSTGHMERDQVYVPRRRKHLGLPPRDQDPEVNGPHSALEESPLYAFYYWTMICIFGWPMYLLVNITGQDYPGWTNHFNPYFIIYKENQFWDIIKSTLGVLTTIATLTYCGQVYGSLNVIKFYVIPYLNVNFWLVLITYLQHTHPDLPHYRDGVWNFQRGAALTVDRSFGFILNHFHHHIADTHVAHHFFSTIPHYHAEEATFHIKKALGKHYKRDDTPIFWALWNSRKHCMFVEEEGDVVFYKN